MRAVVQDRFGGPEVLILGELPDPEPGPTEILVRVRAAGVNPVDWATRAGEGMFEEPPFVLGWDVAGVVEQVGVGVTRFRPGDDVFGMPRFPLQAGAYAELVTGPSRQFARQPTALDHVEAAALPLAGLTAWQILVDLADVQPGQRVLVTAAAGGVGHLAVQIAKARGAFVIGTARAGKHDFLRRIGLDEPIDYTRTTVADVVRDVDVVVDCLGGASSVDLMPVLRRGGLLVPVLGGVTPDIAAAAERYGVNACTLLVEPDGHALGELAALAERGLLRPEIQATYDLADAATAHEVGEQGRTRGKLVLTVD
ncbi:Alcohol dehydrogenase GroES domain protein [Kribbella flavida DSM 17836]|uniref:Alcohol dehydrogenase GroES domain protein n=1 Tax=Kribbella flavida (strain DSM 17836 / JCM 10339 / NBRC 14399) TaxID=479435 RepID=D2PQY2_KRIFD|nr:NADP-dependent oxidoreductase [Kribbella flavida]ADB31115.1 Alcohol dehydrogenase GroES domain protein [Kribbella flavida DSM 17836]